MFVENRIITTFYNAGSDQMENCKKEFINFLMQEDLIWYVTNL